MMKSLLLLSLIVFQTLFTQANERILPAKILLNEGYQKVQFAKRLPHTDTQDPLPVGTLNWPVAFFSESQMIGNSMAQYQPFDNPGYFHGGCDLRVKQNEKVYATVSGRLEAGHYSYTTNSDGSMTKYWKAWPQTGDSTYFEVAVVNDEGYRFEYHHMDRKRLPAQIISILNAGGGRVEAGTYLGDAVYFSSSYHHIHYNIVAPDGIRINPESVSLALPDTTAPQIKGVYAHSGSDVALTVTEGSVIRTKPSELVVWTRDQLNLSIYDQPPVYIKLQFKSGESFEWDFRRTLTDKTTGLFPNLFSFILKSLRTTKGTLNTEGGYGTGSSLIRLPLPQNAHGEFSLILEDLSGNHSEFKAELE